ncbi:SCAN domain-containing protein 3 [Trichinella murrelli]|uniref:SCAN domain-containing protein 3 n=1 Tax=Trichinella murrelli TaxID=144512 RepID=A0A0V0T6K1_9BILA|nr:SCAN domain-containing protein 3 [Trichinella murrelli]
MCRAFKSEHFQLSLAYLADIFEALNSLNLKLQGANANVMAHYDIVQSFIAKISLWLKQVERGNLTWFSRLNELFSDKCISEDLKSKIKEHLRSLQDEFFHYFPDVEPENLIYKFVRNPFLVNVEDLPHDLQEEAIELQFNSLAKDSFESMPLENFWAKLQAEYPKISSQSLRILVPFSSTYLCETGFSALMTLNTQHRNRNVLLWKLAWLDATMKQNIALHISEPETDSLMQKYLNLKHQRSFSVVESSAELTSEDEESETFRKTEFRWKNRRMPPIDATFKETASGSSCVLIEPVQYFRQYFHPTLLNHIVEQCHVCAAQCNSNFQITESELETFLGALLKMGLVPKPRYSMYWSTELRCDAIADAMSRNRFREVLRYLHFNDNSEAVLDRESPRYDRLYKIRPLIESIRQSYLQYQSIDEEIIPYKGRNELKQYIPKKPKKWGIKVNARTGMSGLLYDFCFYEGKVPRVKKPSGCLKYIKYGFVAIEKNGVEVPQFVVCLDTLSNDALRPTRLQRHLHNRHPELSKKPVEYFCAKRDSLSQMRLDKKGKYNQETAKAVKVSYEIAKLIAKNKKPHTIGENLVKPCIVNAVKILLGDDMARQFKNISLSDSTVKRRIDELADDIQQQVLEKVNCDECIDHANCAQLIVYVRFIANNTIEEELLFSEPLKTSTK